jgi:hypothetical protein
MTKRFILILLLLSCQKILPPNGNFNKFFGVITLNPNAKFETYGYLNENETLKIGFRALNAAIPQIYVKDENGNQLFQLNNLQSIDTNIIISKSQNYYIDILNGSQSQKIFIRITKAP